MPVFTFFWFLFLRYILFSDLWDLSDSLLVLSFFSRTELWFLFFSTFSCI